ncbi:MAG: dihydrolipoamide acetyltransferase family protein [Planctomycetota bacterium]|nr:dihydrolipoamide acetyltransferase family protein [Planctomycetota bacterium]
MPSIKLPQVGKAGGGTVRRWRKKVGEDVRKGDILLEIETEEGVVEVESGVEGVLARVVVGEGKSVTVGGELAVVGGEGSGFRVQGSEKKASSEEVTGMSGEQAKAAGGKVVAVLMPKAGQSMEEGTVVKWHVKEGARIEKGQVIFEIETDKATMDVEATDAGRVAKIVAKEGDVVKVLEAVAYLAETDEDVAAAVAEGTGSRGQGSGKQEEAVAGTNVEAGSSVAALPAVVIEGGRLKTSPAARKVASERGVDLGVVGMGSGPGGRILSTDVPMSTPMPVAGEAAAPRGGEGAGRWKMSKMRKAIAENLSLSKRTIPHFYVRATVNAEALLAFYQGQKAKYPCSINDVVVMACAKGIREFPQFRSRIEGEEIVQFEGVNIGIAVGMDEGLVVPVVVNADQKTLKELGMESKRIATAAKGGKIEGMGKGMFTITNMGMLGVEEFAAIVNPPEVGILAVGAVREEVIVSGGTLKAGKVMTMTLSVDHRVIDGIVAAKFMARLKELVERPGQMV